MIPTLLDIIKHNWAGAYLAVLAFHFAWGLHLLRRGYPSMALGPLQRPWQILTVLALINGLGLSVLLWPAPMWLRFNILWHILFAIDEARRLPAYAKRWPFLVNHLLWAALLAA